MNAPVKSIRSDTLRFVPEGHDEFNGRLRGSEGKQPNPVAVPEVQHP